MAHYDYRWNNALFSMTQFHCTRDFAGLNLFVYLCITLEAGFQQINVVMLYSVTHVNVPWILFVSKGWDFAGEGVGYEKSLAYVVQGAMFFCSHKKLIVDMPLAEK